ncbi:hypothetical protein PV772_19385 [Pseudarthrobacter sp. CC12]|uniref:hypothetical protein n=1 Tax=Pseudarthrobacter sp. CC12 TaxID=3029193 RepID=UPI0032642584
MNTLDNESTTAASSSKGFVIIMHDLEPGWTEEYLRWHSRQHMPERVSTFGFEYGRRLRALDASPAHPFLIIYEGESERTFAAKPYIDRLNRPTEWSQRMLPRFTNFIRAGGRIAWSAGEERGLFICVFTLPEKLGSHALRSLERQLGALVTDNCLSRLWIGSAGRAVAGQRTSETELRESRNGQSDFGTAIVAEAHDVASASSALSVLHELLARIPGADIAQGGMYKLDLAIDHDEAVVIFDAGSTSLREYS